ncbi:MAG: phytanoyl-CoA dioxygenase family protein [Vicingaceae bacterium]
MEKYRIQASTENLEQKTLSLLAEYGVLIIENYLSQTEIEKLLPEYDTILETENEAIKSLSYPQGVARQINFEKLKAAEFPQTAETFNAPFMKEVSDAYLGRPNFFNHEIYVAKDEHEEHNALNELHYDKLSTLKFFLYLNDIDKSNGAFEAVPSSHKLAQEIMSFYQERGKKIKNLPNREIPGKLEKPIPIEGKAGSLIVFTTDTYHRAGRVEKGKERKIMRGHCRRSPMPKYAPDLFSKQWLNESFLNPKKYLYGLTDLMGKKKPY